MIFCLDPAAGTSGACGVAVFARHPRMPYEKKGRVWLLGASIIRAQGTDLKGQRLTAMNVCTWLYKAGWPIPMEAFVAEWPQVYPRRRMKGRKAPDPNVAVLPLCGVVAHVSALITAEVERVTYLPHEWKGSIDGDAFAERIFERLDETEKGALDPSVPAGLRHNMLDAVGLGLKFGGRLERHRVIAR